MTRALAGVALGTPLDTLLSDLALLAWPHRTAPQGRDARVVVAPRLGARQLAIRLEDQRVVAVTATYERAAAPRFAAAEALPWRRQHADGAYFADATTLVHVRRDGRAVVLLDAQSLRDRAATAAVYRALFDRTLGGGSP